MKRSASQRLQECEQAIAHTRTVQLQFVLEGKDAAAVCAEERVNVLLHIWKQLHALCR